MESSLLCNGVCDRQISTEDVFLISLKLYCMSVTRKGLEYKFDMLGQYVDRHRRVRDMSCS